MGMKTTVDDNFRDKVVQIIQSVPAGRVTTYGDVASLAGHPTAARVVGGIAHYGSESLPWHRLVNRNGRLARGFPGGPSVQWQLLDQEGVTCTHYKVDNFQALRWTYGTE